MRRSATGAARCGQRPGGGHRSTVPPAPAAPSPGRLERLNRAAGRGAESRRGARPGRSGLASAAYRLIAHHRNDRCVCAPGRAHQRRRSPPTIREWISNGPFVLTIGNAGGGASVNADRSSAGASGAIITRLVLPSDNQ
jgi:hypothetical protein